MKEGIVGKLAGDRYNQNTLHACGKLQTIKNNILTGQEKRNKSDRKGFWWIRVAEF